MTMEKMTLLKARQAADANLFNLKRKITAHQLVVASLEKELEIVRKKFAPTIEQLETEIKTLDGEALAFAKLHAAVLFGDRDRVDLKNGAYLHATTKPVKRVRTMLETLKEQGKDEAIQIIEKVNWDVVETWTDEQLVEVGTERVPKESFAYELLTETQD